MNFRSGAAIGMIGAAGRDRVLSPAPVGAATSRRSDPARYAFPIGFVAVVLLFALPASLLVYLGLYSDQPGGNPLTKFMPTTYLAVVGGFFALYGKQDSGGVIGLFREHTALAWSGALIILCALYSVIAFGISGVATYVDTFLSAILLTTALQAGTERQRRMLGYTILTFCVINVAISVLEGRTETHFLPVDPEAANPHQAFDMNVDEFRGAAFYTHPLTGAMVTAMALFMVLGMRLRGWVAAGLFGVFAVGLMSFGGRGALITAVFMITTAALFQLASGLATRRLSVGFLGAFVAGVVLIPTLFVVLTTMTDVGMRIMTHLYLDSSAENRILQWRVLDQLNMTDVLFGASPAQIEVYKVQVGITGIGSSDIENPWLLLFLSLGLVGFPFLIGSLFLFLLHLGRRVNSGLGWMLVIATLLICSTNNSLGRKAPDLLFLTAIMTALSGFASEQRQTSAPPSPVQHTFRDAALALTPRRRARTLSDERRLGAP